MRSMKRFAGTGTGAMVAVMACIGCTSEEMMKAFEINMRGTLVGPYEFSDLDIHNPKCTRISKGNMNV